jgi:hypothetical protein
MNGKGSRPRPVNLKRFRQNFDVIFRKREVREKKNRPAVKPDGMNPQHTNQN